MIKNYLTITLLAFISAFGINELSAQQKEVQKKVIVIEKTVDTDGKVVSKKVVKEGKEADAYIKQLNEEGEITIDVDATHEGAHVVKKSAFKIATIDDNGNEEIIEWNGEGDMPVEIKEMLEKEDIELGANSNHSTFMFKSNTSGDEEEIEISFGEGEISDEVIKVLKEENINVNITAPNKAQLGVMIKDNDNNEVEIIEVVEESAAEEAGLLLGDIIRKVNDIKVKDFDHLLEILSEYAPSDKLRIGITRDGQKTYKDVVLKEAKSNAVKYKFIQSGDSPQIKDVEKDIEIIIEKKN